MPLPKKTIAALAVTALLTACPALADSAGAHPGGQHPRSHHSGTTADHLAGLRRGTAHAIAAQLKAVQRLADRAAVSTVADATALQAGLAADLTAVQADAAAVGSAASRQDLRTARTAALVTRQVARLQFRAVVTADGLAAHAAELSSAVATLQAELAALAAGGTDTSVGDAALADANTQLATAAAQAPGVVAYVLFVSPAASRSDLHAAAGAVHTALATIRGLLEQAEQDIATVQTQFGL
jgi:hypothetical protein